MEKKQTDGSGPSRLEQGCQRLVLSAMLFCAYKWLAKDADGQQIFALLTVTLTVAATNDLLSHFRGLKKNN